MKIDVVCVFATAAILFSIAGCSSAGTTLPTHTTHETTGAPSIPRATVASPTTTHLTPTGNVPPATTSPTPTYATTPTTALLEPIGPTDLVASNLRLTDDCKVAVDISNNGTRAGPFEVSIYLQGSSPVLLDTFGVDGVSANTSIEAGVSVDDLIPAYRKAQPLAMPGVKVNLEAVVDSENAVDDTNRANNKTSVSDIVMARAPLLDAHSYDMTKVYDSSNQDELLDIAKNGPLKPLFDSQGLKYAAFTLKVLPENQALEEYNKVFGTNYSNWGLREVAFIHNSTSGTPEIVLSQGTFPQVMTGLVRELSILNYEIENNSGFRLGMKIGSAGSNIPTNEIVGALGQYYAIQWFADNGVPLANASYEVNKLGVDWGFKVNNANGIILNKYLRAIWELFPDGAPSSQILAKLNEVVNLPDPTDFTLELLNDANSLDANKIKQDAYWASLVSKKQSALLSPEVCQAIGASSPVTIDDVIADQDGPVYPPLVLLNK